MGCFIDDYDYSDLDFVASTEMTQIDCIHYCAQKNYFYAGLKDSDGSV
jgi:hypothetical protein